MTAPFDSDSDPLAQAGALLAQRTAAPKDGVAQLREALWQLQRYPGLDRKVERSRLLQTVAWRFLHLHGDTTSAVEPSAQAVLFAQGDTGLSAVAQVLQGRVLFEAGTVGDGLALMANGLDLAQRHGDRAAEATAWTSIGAAFIDASLYADAAECVRYARDLGAETLPGTLVHAKALLASATGCLHLQNWAEGVESAIAGAAILDRPSSDEEAYVRTLLEVMHTRLLIMAGRHGDAAQRAQKAVTYAQATCSQHARTMAQIAAGLARIAGDDHDGGVATCVSAIQDSGNNSRTQREAIRAVIPALDRIGRSADALALQKRLTVLMRSSQYDAIYRYTRFFTSPAAMLTEGASTAPAQPRPHLLEEIALSAELRDDPSGEHAYRVARLSALLWSSVGDGSHTPAQIEEAARLHDIGKATLPSELLLKEAAPTPLEREILQRHSNMGAELIARSAHPLRELAAEIARFHHEHFDGSGYPEGLSGSAIPLAARVLTVCDAFDAMTHDKPYRQARSVTEALTELQRCRGRQFDPELVDALSPIVLKLSHEHGPLDPVLGAAAGTASLRVAASRIRAAMDRSVSRAPQRSNAQAHQPQQRRLMRD